MTRHEPSSRPTWALALATALVALSACSAEDTTDSSGDDSTEAQTAAAYDFQLAGPYERIDAMGVALTSTALTNRDRRQLFTNQGPGDDNQNKFQKDSPVTEVSSAAYHLVTFRHYLAKMHGGWAEQLRAKGFEPCSRHVPLLDIEAVTPCTTQRLRRNHDPDGPVVLDVAIPDWVTLSVDEPLGFPNGRILDEQVNDAVLAMGFLKMGGECPGDTSGKAERNAAGVPICNVETFRNVALNPPKNDREFSSTFPYFAKPWFYDVEPGFEYWPTRPRKSSP